MKWAILVVGVCSQLGCPPKTSNSSTTPSSGGGSANQGGGRGGGGGNAIVPDIMGKTQSEAEAAVAAAGIRGGLRIGNDPGTWNASSTICNQTPGVGRETAPSLFVSIRFCIEERSSSRDTDGDLTGLTIEDAKKKIAAAGYTNVVKVDELYEYDKTCKEGTVCRFSPRRWYTNGEGPLILSTNRTLTLSAPE